MIVLRLTLLTYWLEGFSFAGNLLSLQKNRYTKILTIWNHILNFTFVIKVSKKAERKLVRIFMTCDNVILLVIIRYEEVRILDH